MSPAELVRQLTYKMAWRGGELVAIDRWYPSSRLCHDCGARNDTLTLAMREWTCADCGVLHDRDGNAADNIRDYESAVTSSVAACGDQRKTGLPAAVIEAGTGITKPLQLPLFAA